MDPDKLNERVARLTEVTNRSNQQTKFLLELVNMDWELLYDLEEKIKNNFVFYCPGDRESVDVVLALPNDKRLLDLKRYKQCEEKRT